MQSAATELLALAVLAAIVALPGLLAVRAARRTRFTPGQAVLMGLNYVYTRVIWRTTIVGAIRLEPGQGAVIVSNHRCPLDPAFVALLADRMVHWMVAREWRHGAQRQRARQSLVLCPARPA